MDRTALGKQVLALRQARGLTLRKAAEASGVSHAYIEAIEKGRPNANITVETLDRIAAGLGGRLELTLVGGPDGVEGLVGALDPGEREKLAIVARALLAAREDPLLRVVVDSAADMIAARTSVGARASS